MKATKRLRVVVRPGGCAFVLAICIFACVMILVNGTLLANFYEPIEAFGRRLLRSSKLGQGFARGVLFVGPVLLLVLEWLVLDRLAGWLRRDRRRA
jgi:hypothetical protein